MVMKVFLIGRPGSGKSTAARYIAMRARDTVLSVMHINDYELLQAMFQADSRHEFFEPTAHGGFNALTPTVLDVALEQVEEQVCSSFTHADLVTIEFARDEYHEAFTHFSPAFLHDACILYTDADLDTCLQRVHERVAHPTSWDDHPSFSDDLFRQHYAKDNTPYMSSQFQKDFACKLVEIVENNGSLEDFIGKIDRFVDMLFASSLATS